MGRANRLSMNMKARGGGGGCYFAANAVLALLLGEYLEVTVELGEEILEYSTEHRYLKAMSGRAEIAQPKGPKQLQPGGGGSADDLG